MHVGGAGTPVNLAAMLAGGWMARGGQGMYQLETLDSLYSSSTLSSAVCEVSRGTGLVPLSLIEERWNESQIRDQ